VLRDTVLSALGLSVKEMAETLGVSGRALHNILTERSPITPEMAVRTGKLCGNGAGLWLRMQQTRDLWHAECDQAAALKTIPTLRAA
jgi:addiction module HigA family antidote